MGEVGDVVAEALAESRARIAAVVMGEASSGSSANM